jgi:hypothetical protein
MVLHVNDLTVDELRALMREVVEEVVEEKIGLLKDPDEGLELREDVIESLKDFLASDQRGDDSDDVFHALGLE